MFYYTSKRKRNKKIILIAVVVALAIALSVLIVVFSDTITGWFSADSEPSDAPTGTPAVSTQHPTPTPQKPLDELGMTISERFGVPDGFERVEVTTGSFGEFLRNYSLKVYGALPKFSDGTDFADVSTQGVLNQVLINANQTSPDAIMFLYAQYLFEIGAYDRIAFDFNTTPTFSFDYVTWLSGQRVDVSVTPPVWYTPDGAEALEPSVDSLQKYMRFAIAYANTSSLKKQLASSNTRNLKVGDVLIYQDSERSHAIIVVDMCWNTATGEIRFICAAGNSPASEMYLLQDADTQSVWLTLEEDGTLCYEDMVFAVDCVKRFEP